MKIRCHLFGHKYGGVRRIGTNMLPNGDDHYNAYCCSRCDHREPASADDARKQRIVRNNISGIMNADRARLGFGPLDWS